MGKAALVRNQMYDGWVSCKEETPYFAGVWMIKVFEWAAIIIGGMAAAKFNAKIRADLLCAGIIAAEFILGSCERAVEDILLLGDPSPSKRDQVNKAMQIVEINKTIFVYILSGLGVFCQVKLTKWWNGEVTERSDLMCYWRWVTKPYVEWMLLPLVKYEGYVIGKLVNSLEAGLEAGKASLENVKEVSQRSMSFDSSTKVVDVSGVSPGGKMAGA